MFVRYAFFEGRIKDGREAEFDRFVMDRLVPMWRRFPHATEVRVMREIERDDGAPPFAMVLAVRYPSREAIAEALASPIRTQSRAETAILLEMFEGRVFHTVTRLVSETVIG
jgi:hypothetical protein